jgi:hypothetical protein
MNNQQLNKINQLIKEGRREQSSTKRQELLFQIVELMAKLL